MEESAQWGLALLVGIPIAVFLAWFNKSGSDFKDGFEKKTKEAEEAERKIRTQVRAEQRRKELERKNKISQEAEKFRLPGGKGLPVVPDFREWLKNKCYEKYQSIPEPFEKAMKTGNPKDLPLLGWSRKSWEYQEASDREPGGPPSTKIGKRGGRYTDGTTKDGRPYRRYF